MIKPNWIKEKGYLHISPSLKLGENWKYYKKNIEDPTFVKSYAFYPLIHNVIKERKYKKGDSSKNPSIKRKHSHYNLETNKPEKSHKIRPLHYAGHMDALIYSYYSELLNKLYEDKLTANPLLDNSINAYRKILIENSDKGKSTIHFAKETFSEIEKRATFAEVCVLTFDLKSFFSSIDHQYLKAKWQWLLNTKKLPDDHYNVFKSCTKFKYVLLDDLRKFGRQNKNKRNTFDESKLAKIRREKGFKCFFESNSEFRKSIKEGQLRIYENPFYRDEDYKKIQIGIPQGLPISATLANLYLYDFDLSIVENFVRPKNVYYRRYSDDIIIICDIKDANEIEDYINKLIEKSKVEISKHKTERFIFRFVEYSPLHSKRRLTSFKIKNSEDNQTIEKHAPLIYLGFEYRGYNTVIKSSNLSKYYRRIISITKRRCRRANKLMLKDPQSKRAIFVNQIRKLYNKPLKINDSDKTEISKLNRRRYSLTKNERGFYEFSHKEFSKKHNSNYYSYIQRCSNIFNNDIFLNQIRKRRHIVHQTISKNLDKNKII